ncbi:MAG: ribonucleoside-diphosphate reductase, alpha subunit, partial [Thermoleophilia bacterium]|nr:ribonucleoside-diphosphate reductase, alpha subunit [Thermoleophilia bacterium]
QKWIDQSQSLNLFLPQPDLKAMSLMYRKAWHVGLKTTYYLRSLGASQIEKSSVTASRFAKPSDETSEAPVLVGAAAPAELATASTPVPAAPVAVVTEPMAQQPILQQPVATPVAPAQVAMAAPAAPAPAPVAPAPVAQAPAAPVQSAPAVPVQEAMSMSPTIPPIITASSPLAAAEAAEAARTATVVDDSVDADFADEQFSAEQLACSIEAMRNGGECEVCQ